MAKKPRSQIAGTAASSYRRGASIRQIARQTGKSYGTVHNALSDKGVKMRSRGGPNHRKKG